jgi:hypothetical protein
MASMDLRSVLKLYIKEIEAHARVNESDAKSHELTEAAQRHAKGFSDAQRWAATRLKKLLRITKDES